MIGLTFNRLTITAIAPRVKKNRARYLCACSCGKEVFVDHYHLLSGHTKSCGCMKIEMLTSRLKTHGKTKSQEYKAWLEMRRRCDCPSSSAYKYYGGRGISVCDRWSDFINFLSDMGEKPSPSHSLDRIDVNGNYEPANCRWATPSVQHSNKRNSTKIEHNGEVLCLSHWAKRYGVRQGTLHYWMMKKGFSLEDAVSIISSRQ